MRQIFHNPEIRQINFLDSRFYSYKNEKGIEIYLPSCTTILDVYPKGFGFNQFLKDVGSNATEIVERAGAIGSKVHGAAEILLSGQELKWCDATGTPLYSIHEWELILRFADFWKKIQPRVLANELIMCSPVLKFGGTLDIVCLIGNTRWLLDIKTSNYIHKSHFLQIAAYAYLWNELNPDTPIEQTGILWLKGSNRTDKIDVDKRIYQGICEAGAWQIKTEERDYHNFYKLFEMTHAIWSEENPNYFPANKTYSDFVILN